jgi:hypothetical protein
VADEQLHAQFLANKIVALGSEPTTQPHLRRDNSSREPRDSVDRMSSRPDLTKPGRHHVYGEEILVVRKV